MPYTRQRPQVRPPRYIHPTSPPCSMSTTTSTVPFPNLHSFAHTCRHTPSLRTTRRCWPSAVLGALSARPPQRRRDARRALHGRGGSAARWPFISETPRRLLRQPGIVSTWGLDHTRVDLADFVMMASLGNDCRASYGGDGAAALRRRPREYRAICALVARARADRCALCSTKSSSHRNGSAGSVCATSRRRSKSTSCAARLTRQARGSGRFCRDAAGRAHPGTDISSAWGLDGAEVNLGDLVGDGGAGSLIVSLVCAAAAAQHRGVDVVA